MRREAKGRSLPGSERRSPPNMGAFRAALRRRLSAGSLLAEWRRPRTRDGASMGFDMCSGNRF